MRAAVFPGGWSNEEDRMDDARIWEFERNLWVGDASLYQEAIDDQCLMVLPAPPFVFTGQQSIEAVKQTPRWSEVQFSEEQVARPQEGLIVIAYKVRASKAESGTYEAHCTSTYRRLAHEEWTVVQHQQTPPLTS
jgi:hypothetical protein